MIRDPASVADFETGGHSRGAAAAGELDKEKAVLASITASYFYLRRGLSLAAFAFPFILWLGADPAHLQTSISAYYHFSPGRSGYGAGAMRDVLVGVHWAIGACLFLYKGYSAREDWALNLAGIAAACIALFPMDWNSAEAARSFTGKVHFASAAVFFLATGYVCLACARDTLDALKDEARRRVFHRLYRIIGSAMWAVPLAVLALYLVADRPRESYAVIAIEIAGIWIFAAFWWVKSREISEIERQ